MNVLITGGSSGIGLAIAYRFAKQGDDLFLVSRNFVKLEKARKSIKSKHDVKVSTYACDVSKYDNIKEVVNEIEKDHQLDYLICSAGRMLCGKIDQIDVFGHRKIMDINYFGVLNTCKAIIPVMKKRKSGKIGIVSSVAGFVSAIGYGGYAPGKFALTGLAECLRMEASDYGIQITIIYPPDTDTPLLKWERNHTLPECLALSKNANVISPSVVAKKLVRGMKKNQFEVYCNFQSKMIRLGRVICPLLYFKWLDKIVKKDRIKREVL